MSDLPTYAEHVRRSYVERRDDSSPYHIRLARAMGKPADGRDMWTNLSWVALNYVNAQSRLAIIATRMPAATQQELDAQSADVTSWQARANAAIGQRAGAAEFYGRVVTTLVNMELESQRLDDDERRHWELGLAGRIDEIIVEPEVHVYHYDEY